MTPFEVYKAYLALKLHFTTDYDIIKEGGRTKASYEAFEKRKDKQYMTRLSEHFNRSKIMDFMVANFVAGDRWGGLFTTESGEKYKQWKDKVKKLYIIFIRDLDIIVLETLKKDMKSPFDIDGQYPLILKLYLGNRINIETLTIINKLDPFVERFDAILENDYVWPDVKRMIIKYSPFLKIRDTREQYENVYEDRMGEFYRGN